MSINIIKNNNFGTHNTTYGRQKPQYIVMHYTASNGGTAANHISYFNNRSTTRASADFFVDDVGIYQYNMQLDSRYSWAVGDGSGGSYGGKCRNSNQISIEMCCYQSGNKWYITDKTYNNALALAQYLMSKYNIPASDVIRHYDVSCKACPNAVGWLRSTGSEATWQKFKTALSGQTAVVNETTETIYRVRKTADDSKTQKGAYKNLQSAKDLANKNAAAGYKVFDQNGKLTYTPKTTPTTSSYQVVITADVLNVRKGAGTNYAITTAVKKNEVYTIVEESDGWGLLKAYQKNRDGWISLNYTKKK